MAWARCRDWRREWLARFFRANPPRPENVDPIAVWPFVHASLTAVAGYSQRPKVVELHARCLTLSLLSDSVEIQPHDHANPLCCLGRSPVRQNGRFSGCD